MRRIIDVYRRRRRFWESVPLRGYLTGVLVTAALSGVIAVFLDDRSLLLVRVRIPDRS